MSCDGRLQVAVWSTVGVGSRAIEAVGRRSDLDLVGVWVHAPEKVGRDVGEIIGGEPLGISATNDAQALVIRMARDVAPDWPARDRDAGRQRRSLRRRGAPGLLSSLDLPVTLPRHAF